MKLKEYIERLLEDDSDVKKFKSIVEKNKKKIAKDPNEFFLDLPSTPMKSPKNNTKIKLDN